MFKIKEPDKNKQKQPETEKRIVGEYLSIHDVDGFFKFVSGALLEAKVEKKTAAQLRNRTGINTGIILMIAILFIAGSIAYMIISSVSANNSCVNELAKIAQQNKRVVNVQQNTPPSPPISSGAGVGIK